MKTYRKGVNEEIFEGFDWSDRLREGDTLATSQWTVDGGLDTGETSFDDTSTEIEMTGGAVDTTYRCTNEVGTTMGSVYERSFKVIVVER